MTYAEHYAKQKGFEQSVVTKEHTLIFLTGFSGSGKSTIGPLLANSLGYEFVDLDQSIEQRAGKTITRIFEENGEEYFRALELYALKGLARQNNMVISLGGGVLENNESYELIQKSGTMVYLKSPSKTLARRLCNKSDRPLLKGEKGQKLSREDIEEKITTILAKREPRYKSADITVETDVKRIGSTVEELTRKIERHVRNASSTSGDQYSKEKL
ncbi:MAG: shikimate kinase [Chlorobiaceae bacterium]|jgi:shikimate kinase|nr:shikimate kinase [Chlorobiaceae bacterium]NTV16331.1 shikimate kinase [Chlorobiaceae bacterium]